MLVMYMNRCRTHLNEKTQTNSKQAYLLFEIVVPHRECKLSHNKVERDEHELVLEVFVLVELPNYIRAQGLGVGKVLDQ